jgi:hypothetical protein
MSRPTLTQAQKAAQRLERQNAALEKMQAAKAARAQALQEQYEKSQTVATTPSLSNKEKRALKKAKKNTTQLNPTQYPSQSGLNSANNHQPGVPEVLVETVRDIMKERKESEVSPSARIISNHSTHCPGLPRLLAKLQRDLPFATLAPGALSTTKANAEHFELRFQRQTENQYYFVARCGHTTQDLAIVVKNPVTCTVELVCRKIDNIINEQKESDEGSDESYDNPNELNHALAEAESCLWMVRAQEKYQKEKHHQQASKKESKIKEQERKLANKSLNRNEIRTFAERDVAIISGDTHTRNSMK